VLCRAEEDFESTSPIERFFTCRLRHCCRLSSERLPHELLGNGRKPQGYQTPVSTR
jgi:hypothetical protein